MATIVEQAPTLPGRPATPPPHMTLNTSIRGSPSAIPNKRIPFCSPGNPPTGLTTPPSTPPSRSATLDGPASVLYPVNEYSRLSENPPVYSIGAAQLAEAIEDQATRPLPDPKLVFPWLHGLHPENAIQLAFFVARKRTPRKIPPSLRGLTLVKVGGDLGTSRLKGAITASEILTPESLSPLSSAASFLDPDPREGFSVRNFQIQPCKMATVSDIILYGSDQTDAEEILFLAKKISRAQRAWKENMATMGLDSGIFNTFIVLDPVKVIEKHHPNIVAVDSNGKLTGEIVDFFVMERLEMSLMTRASEIAPNFYVGPTPDPSMLPLSGSPGGTEYDVLIEASDLAQMPDAAAIESLRETLDGKDDASVLHIEIPGSGSIMPPTWSHVEVDGLMGLCRWIWEITRETESEKPQGPAPDLADPISRLASGAKETTIEIESGQLDDDGDTIMTTPSPSTSSTSLASAVAPVMTRPSPRRKPKKVLLHCPDGYTETTLIALTYYMYAHGLTVAEAWIRMHVDRERNFFAYATDVAVLTAIQPRILSESPARKAMAGLEAGGVSAALDAARREEPEWLGKLDGSLPSRILPYMYLGNLGHANNPSLLRELGIGRVVSVGERVSSSEPLGEGPVRDGPFAGIEFCMVDGVQDNGVDSLSGEFERCLNFIERGKVDGVATLVHCRVGVSRSATICIAEVMKEMGLSFPRAYCFVRARRLNVIIQPHLRFTYELLKWEEELQGQRGKPLRRELEWAHVTREIAAMNRPYSRG